MKKYILSTSLIMLSRLVIATPDKTSSVDLIVYGKIYTIDSAFTEVEGVVIKSGKIVYAGTKGEIMHLYTSKNILDIPGAYIYPGFIDAHCHFSGYALDGYKCDLTGTKSFSEVLERLRDYEQNNTLPWIYGRGWDQNDWPEKVFPNKKELDARFPNKPVILKRIDGHAIIANQKALDMAKITPATTIDGGIVETKDGMLTGILIDNATEPVEKLITMLPKNVAEKYLRETEAKCFKEGLTGVVDCGVQKDVISLVEGLYKKGELTINNSILLSQDKETINTYAARGPYKRPQFQVNGIKVYSDGALGSRGACLLNDYEDMHGHKGMILTSYHDMNELAGKAKKYGWQLCTHAIGDSANRAILDMYGFHLKGRNNKRWRIEHAQVVDKQDYTKFRQYSIVPSVQPTHAISDMPWAETRLGPKRIPQAYAYNQLLMQTGWIALGTDFPVEDISPLATFYTAVVRKDSNGIPASGFQKENALSRKDALKGMTIWAAKSVFQENEKGSLEVGKDADITILDTDLLTESEDKLPAARVLCTIVKGKIVYKQ